jgi:hypothetical protein
MIGRSSISINCTHTPNRLSLFKSTILVCLGAALSLSLPVHAIEWGPIYLGAGVDRFFFSITVLDVPASETDHVFNMYTKMGVIIVQTNQEEFSVVLDDTDASIVEGPQVAPLGAPDFDRWKDGTVTDLTASKSEAGDWTISGSIDNGTQPYLPGDQLGELRFTYSGGILAFGSPLIGAPPEASMYVTKTSSTQRVKRAGQVVPYEYVVGNGGQIILHNVALSDDNVDETPVCAFPGEDQLAVEGEPGDSVVCTAQHTVTQEEFNAGDTLDNNVTATSDEAEPVTASFSIPIVVFADGFETSRVNTITSINASPVGLHTFIAIGSDGYPIISFGDQIAGSLRLIKCDGVKCNGSRTTIATIDTQGAWVGWPSAVAIGENDFPIIAYSGNVSVWNPLLIAQCNDLACDGADEELSVADHPDFHVGYGISIVIGPDGFPIISHSTELEGVASLRVTKCNDPACSGDDEASTTLQDGVGGGATSMAIANDGFPVIANFNREAHQLVVIKCDDLACTGGGESITVVTDDILGDNLSLALGADGFPVIAYQGNLGPALKVIKCNDLACAGNDETISVVDNVGEDPGSYPRIAIGVDGNPIIAYWDRVGALGQLVVASCNDPACAGGDEMITVVDGPSHVGQGISLAIGSDGLPIISYLDGPYPHSLKVLHCGAANCAQ